MKKILLLIDCQYDFLDGGKLGVDGSIEIMNRLIKYLNEHYKEYDGFYFTVDWHMPTHCSFKENGGIWPPHCIQYSKGAAIYQPLLDFMEEHKIDYTVLTKGLNEDHEEYSVFKNAISSTYLKAICKAEKVEQVDFVGIALNYCVRDSSIDSKKVFTDSKIRVLKDFCPSIGDGSDAIKEMENNGIEVV